MRELAAGRVHGDPCLRTPLRSRRLGLDHLDLRCRATIGDCGYRAVVANRAAEALTWADTVASRSRTSSAPWRPTASAAAQARAATRTIRRNASHPRPGSRQTTSFGTTRRRADAS